MAAGFAARGCLCHVKKISTRRFTTNLIHLRYYPSSIRCSFYRLCSSAPAQLNEEVQKSKKKRDRFTVLKALSSTVNETAFRYDGRFIEDNRLYPRGNHFMREHLEAMEMGKQAAQLFIEKYPEHTSLRKPVPAWGDESSPIDLEPTLKNLQVLLKSSAMKKSPELIELYVKLKEQETLPIEVHNEVLDYAAYHAIPANINEVANNASETLNEEQTSSSSSSSSDDEVDAKKAENHFKESTWSIDGFADRLFSELQNTGNAISYEIFILNLLHHNEFLRAFHLYNDFKDKGFRGSQFLYDQLIINAGEVREDLRDRWELVEEVIAEMNDKGIVPSRSTFNALISVTSTLGHHAEQLCEQILDEMTEMGIKPSLGTLFKFVVAFEKKGRAVDKKTRARVMEKLISELTAGKVIANFVHPDDVRFLPFAMHSIMEFGRVDLARKLVDYIATNNMDAMVGDMKDSFYSRYLTMLSKYDPKYFMVEFDRLINFNVVKIFPWFIKSVLSNVGEHKNPCYIPMVFEVIRTDDIKMKSMINLLFRAMTEDIPNDMNGEFLEVLRSCQTFIENNNIKMTNYIALGTLHILCSNNLAEEAFESTKKFHEKGFFFERKVLLTVIKTCIETGDHQLAIDALRFMPTMDTFRRTDYVDLISSYPLLKNDSKLILSFLQQKARKKE